MINSYLFYIITVLLSTIFAELAQKYSWINKSGKRVPHSFLWLISMAILIFVMGFRANSVGVDDLSYLKGYNIANSMGLIEYYETHVTEPGFYFLYRVVYLLFYNFQWLIILTSTITILCFYKALSYEIENTRLALGVFIFSSTQYFYYFGIIRMGLAVSIIAIGYRYILENKKKKYIYMVLLATMFHYSALFALVLLFIKSNKNMQFKRNTIIKIALIIPLAFCSVRLLIYPFIMASRYQRYIKSSGIISTSFITSMPIFVLFLFHYNRFCVANRSYQFYFYLFIIKVFTEIFSPIIGIGRMVWYVNLSLCFLLPGTIRVNKNYFIKVILLIFTILYCIFYSYNAYFGESYRSLFMLPYRNIFFEIAR
ncbi:EpsG family protein [Clostridium cochlearium]|uniref:EpsG family protein n=1 Tax=Clostridium cochlearium TaxID=1494 RepID=A0A7Y3XYK1_CLOCO|nr:EpsG family protein [Clostridium cochlearium]NOH16237.1 EpsG family protein [Clostridium cochlearium]